jgi:hypothetical protein
MSGASTFTVTYSANSTALYGTGGVPSMNDINQGYLGDCYYESALAEVAYKNPSIIESMITSNGNNTYGVRFYVNGIADYVTVSNMLADGGLIFNTTSGGEGLWASLAEQAYAQIQASGDITGNGSAYNYGNSFSTIGNGGYPEYTLAEVTGATQITDFNASRSSWTKDVYNNSINYVSGASGLSTATVLTSIASALTAGDDVLLGSYTNAYDSNGKQTLVSDHELSIYGYDSSTGNLEIRNPWGTESSGQYWDTTFEVSLSTLLADGDQITMDNAGTGSGGGGGGTTVTGALVSQAAALQASTSVASFTISDLSSSVWGALSALNSDSKLTSIAFTDGTAPSLSLTGAAYAADATVLAKITSAYSLTVTGAGVAQASGLQSNSKVTSFSVSDSAQDVSGGLAALAGDSKLSSITLTDASKPTLSLTYAVYSADSAALNKISSPFNLAVTGASVAQASSLQSNSKVTSFTVIDTEAHVASGLSALANDSKLTSIALSNPYQTMNLAYSAYEADASALDKFSAYYIGISGASMATKGGSLDLAGLAFENGRMMGGFYGSARGGTLLVSNGAQTVDVALLGNYLSSTFSAASDGHGGTMITDAAKTSHAAPILAPKI